MECEIHPGPGALMVGEIPKIWFRGEVMNEGNPS